MSLERFCISSISLRQLRRVDDREERLANSLRASSDHLHLGDGGGREEGLKEPEDPGKEGWNIDEELARLFGERS